jgi:hypothetical protein
MATMTTVSRTPKRSALQRLPKSSILRAGLLLLIVFLALNVNNNRNSNLATNDFLTSAAGSARVPPFPTVVDVAGRTCLNQAPLSNVFAPGSTLGSGNCSYSWGQGWHSPTSSTLQQDNSHVAALQSRLKELIKEWKFDNKLRMVRKYWPNRIESGKRVLDVGMGQGPWGAAMLSTVDLEYYVGLDPDVCPPIQARTRDSSVKRKGSYRQCLKAYNLTSETEDPERMEACVGKNKYHFFELTGMQMMAAYPNRLALLPGTFETLSDQLQSMVFDIILLNTVTEHLTQLRPVFEGLYQLMGSGCSKDATVLIDHHNYADYGGHHGFPKTPAELADAAPELKELADWGHLTDDASQSQNPSLNRVRAGDLQALLNVYFDCSCIRTYCTQAERDRMTPEKRLHFETLGFDIDMELFTKHIKWSCTRRDAPLNPSILDKLNLYHSPLDGSYQPEPFTNCQIHKNK